MVHTNKLTLISLLPFFDNVNTISFSNYRKLPRPYSRVSAWENVKDPFTASKSEQCVQFCKNRFTNERKNFTILIFGTFNGQHFKYLKNIGHSLFQKHYIEILSFVKLRAQIKRLVTFSV